MFRISYEDILHKIQREKGVQRDELEKKVREKLNKLGDLISKEGAAHIVANEYGVKVFEEPKKRVKVGELSPGMRPLEVAGKVVRKFETRSFKKENREGKVTSFLMGDDTGMIRVTCWDEKLISEIDQMAEDAVVLVMQALVKDNNGLLELHLGSQSGLTINPLGLSVEVKAQPLQASRKEIKAVKENEVAEVWGTVVQAFEPRFYEACPECNRKVQQDNDKLRCPAHGIVAAKAVPIASLTLDDGTDNIRVTCFRELAAKLFGVEEEQLMKIRESPAEAEQLKQKVIGQQVKITGRVRKNEMFARLELSAFQLEPLDPKAVVEELAEDV